MTSFSPSGTVHTDADALAQAKAHLQEISSLWWWDEQLLRKIKKAEAHLEQLHISPPIDPKSGL